MDQSSEKYYDRLFSALEISKPIKKRQSAVKQSLSEVSLELIHEKDVNSEKNMKESVNDLEENGTEYHESEKNFVK